MKQIKYQCKKKIQNMKNFQHDTVLFKKKLKKCLYEKTFFQFAIVLTA
ncbi:hypothetical protein SAMN04487930_10185 [Cytophaga hutchinsonii ATCC 33406]|nr:hypothetical protein SAMN04487930_10185 [Cytophaga hutchinsonii ATCC 33406]